MFLPEPVKNAWKDFRDSVLEDNKKEDRDLEARGPRIIIAGSTALLLWSCKRRVSLGYCPQDLDVSVYYPLFLSIVSRLQKLGYRSDIKKGPYTLYKPNGNERIHIFPHYFVRNLVVSAPIVRRGPFAFHRWSALSLFRAAAVLDFFGFHLPTPSYLLYLFLLTSHVRHDWRERWDHFRILFGINKPSLRVSLYVASCIRDVIGKTGLAVSWVGSDSLDFEELVSNPPRRLFLIPGLFETFHLGKWFLKGAKRIAASL